MKNVTIGNQTTFEEITNIQSFEEKKIIVHYVSVPHLRVKEYIHTVDIPILANELKIQNWFEGVKNEGAELSEGFSRYEFQLNNQIMPNAIMNFDVDIHKDAFHLEYRDTSGNISTSAVDPETKSQHVTLLPRYPLLSDWQTEFNLNYHIPKDIYMSQGKTIIELPIVDKTIVEHCILRIYLPDGAKYIKFESNDIKEEKIEINDHEAFMSFSERKEILIHLHNINLMQKNKFAIYYEESSSAIANTYIVAFTYIITIFVGFFFFIKYSA